MQWNSFFLQVKKTFLLLQMKYSNNNTKSVEAEVHPLQPFLPHDGRILFLGSFPPPRERWSMEFFYPNWINDFWRIIGLIHFGDKTYFESRDGNKQFDKERIMQFATAAGLAFYDTAVIVRRLRGNASDEHLEIVQPTDIGVLLQQMPSCCDIVTTGGKASDTLYELLSSALGKPVTQPGIGESTIIQAYSRMLRWWRMPSSSRAYPLKIEKKAEYYQRLFKK